MRKLPLVVAGIAGLVVAGTAALAADSGPHEMTVRLPGGGIEHIEYKGNVAPRIVVRQSPFDVTWPVMIGFEPSSFAMFDRMAAQMDREMAAFRQQAESLQNIAMPNGQGLDEAALRNLPPGAMSYSSVRSFSTGSGMCSRSVEGDAVWRTAASRKWSATVRAIAATQNRGTGFPPRRMPTTRRSRSVMTRRTATAPSRFAAVNTCKERAASRALLLFSAAGRFCFAYAVQVWRYGLRPSFNRRSNPGSRRSTSRSGS